MRHNQIVNKNSSTPVNRNSKFKHTRGEDRVDVEALEPGRGRRHHRRPRVEPLAQGADLVDGGGPLLLRLAGHEVHLVEQDDVGELDLGCNSVDILF